MNCECRTAKARSSCFPTELFIVFRWKQTSGDSNLSEDIFKFLTCIAATDKGVRALIKYNTICTLCKVLTNYHRGEYQFNLLLESMLDHLVQDVTYVSECESMKTLLFYCLASSPGECWKGNEDGLNTILSHTAQRLLTDVRIKSSTSTHYISLLHVDAVF